MKHFYGKLATFLTLLFLMPGAINSTKACNLSQITLDSIVFDGTRFQIYLQFCVGGGVLGPDAGADGSTRTFAFGFYTPGSIAVSEYPTSLTSDTTATTYNGFPFGAGFQGAAETIAYLDNGTDFTCAQAGQSPDCGLPHSDCQQVRFGVDVIPDSIRLFGIEGANSPLSGCYPNPDMLIDFTSLLPVVWASFEGKLQDDGIYLDWATAQETNNDHFLITRSFDGIEFSPIGQVKAAGNTSGVTRYDFIDRNPLPGTNYYRIVQVDLDGSTGESEILSLTYDPPAGMSWISVAPVPSSDFVSLSFLSATERNLTLEVFDIRGTQVLSQPYSALPGMNEQRLDIRSLPAGMYSVRLYNHLGVLEKKIIKQ